MSGDEFYDDEVTSGPVEGPCIFSGCVSRDRHQHGGFPGGYDNPTDPEGAPLPFTSEPAPGVRDYNGALLDTASAGRPALNGGADRGSASPREPEVPLARVAAPPLSAGTRSGARARGAGR